MRPNGSTDASGETPEAAIGAGVRRRVVDLGLAIDRDASLPFPDQLERSLADLVARGELAPATSLPSSRALAADLGVSRGVVVEAYDRLLRQGVLVSQPGGAVRVSPSLPEVDAAALQALADDAQALEQASPAFDLDLHPASTPIGTFDRRAWGAALRLALRDAPEADLASLDAAGLPGLREALVAQLARSRGVVTTAAQLAITGGVTDALRGLTPLLTARGGRVAVEDPGFGVHRATLIGGGIELVPVHADQHGIDVEALAAADVCAVLVTPAHQMPLGVPLSPDRRAALVDWARANDAWLIEDDYDGELRYDRRGVRSLHGLAPDRVVYLGTTSKVLSPAIRVGWMVVPPALQAEAFAWRHTLGGAPSNLVQAALAEYLRSGAFDRGLARMRRRCAAARSALVAAITEAVPQVTIEGVEAGLHLSVRVAGLEPWRIVVAAQTQGVQLFATDDGPDAIALVGFGLIEPAAAPAVAERLARVIAAARES